MNYILAFLLPIFAVTISVIALLLAITFTASANPYQYRVTRVLDGDTIEFDAPFLPVELKQVLKLRIIEVDTPEKGSLAKCQAEADKALRATDFTKRMVGTATRHEVVLVGWDKYGGRVLGDLLLDGKSLKRMLIETGHARPYDGGKKASWCN